MPCSGPRTAEPQPHDVDRPGFMRRLAVPVLASVLLAVLPAAAGPSKPLAVGEKAPDFTLTDQHAKPFRLSELLATRRYVVLAFYVQAFTPG